MNDVDKLLDIQEYANLILENLADIDEEAFYNSRVLQLGLLKMPETIGEAVYQISRATKAEFTMLEWDKMIGARHVYVHDYFKIDWTKIWVSLNTIDFAGIIQEVNNIIEVLRKRFLV